MTVPNVTITEVPQPAGRAGQRFTVDQVAKVAAKHRDNVHVRAWVSHLLKAEGITRMEDTTATLERQLERARVITKWVQNEVIWMPDPKGREFIPAPHLLVPNGSALPFLAGDDCDGKSALLLCLLLVALNTIDMPVAAVGHGYDDKAPELGHVLAAVGSDWNWSEVFYIDPSTKIPFGKCMPFSWERIVTVPDCKVICDDKVCLRGPNHKRIVRDVTAGGGGVVSHMHTLAGIPNSVGAAPGVPDDAQRQLWGENLTEIRGAVDRALRALLVVEGGAARMEQILGAPLPPTLLTEQRIVQIATAIDAGRLLVRWLDEVIAGKRDLVIGPGAAGTAASGDETWSLGGLPTDLVIVQNNETSFWLEERAALTDAFVQKGPNVLAGRTVRRNTLGSLPVIVLGAAGFVAIHAAGAWLTYSVLEKARDIFLGAMDAWTTSAYADCLRTGSPAECAKWAKAVEEARATGKRAEAELVRARNEPTTKALELGKVIVVVTALGGAVAVGKWAYDEFIKPKRRAA